MLARWSPAWLIVAPLVQTERATSDLLIVDLSPQLQHLKQLKPAAPGTLSEGVPLELAQARKDREPPRVVGLCLAGLLARDAVLPPAETDGAAKAAPVQEFLRLVAIVSKRPRLEQSDLLRIANRLAPRAEREQDRAEDPRPPRAVMDPAGALLLDCRMAMRGVERQAWSFDVVAIAPNDAATAGGITQAQWQRATLQLTQLRLDLAQQQEGAPHATDAAPFTLQSAEPSRDDLVRIAAALEGETAYLYLELLPEAPIDETRSGVGEGGRARPEPVAATPAVPAAGIAVKRLALSVAVVPKTTP